MKVMGSNPVLKIADYLRVNDIGSASVCFDFPITNVVQLSLLFKVIM
jgi:hypothetical protein